MQSMVRDWSRRLAPVPTSSGALDGGVEPQLHPALVDALLRHRYRTNVRELGRLLMVSASSSPGKFLNLTSDVAAELETAQGNDADTPSSGQIRDALDAAHGNKSEAAKLLGLKSRFALYRLMKKRET
jgi:two-component system nitrogen regulation response regulator GlnG/two-component system response regulator HydG